jgi:hypothetical protein
MGWVGLVLGAILLAAGVAAWTGRWRSWARQFAFGVLPAPLGLFPGLGLGLIAYGLSGVGAVPLKSPVTAIGVLAAFAGLALSFWAPAWFGPAWYREDPKLDAPDLGDPTTAVAYAGLRPAPAVPAGGAAWEATEPLEVLRATWLAGDAAAAALPAFGGGTDVGGRLELHADGLVFRANGVDARTRQSSTVVAVSGEEVRGARADGRGTLVVDTAGGPMTFKVFGAGGKAARVRELYGG